MTFPCSFDKLGISNINLYLSRYLIRYQPRLKERLFMLHNPQILFLPVKCVGIPILFMQRDIYVRQIPGRTGRSIESVQQYCTVQNCRECYATLSCHYQERVQRCLMISLVKTRQHQLQSHIMGDFQGFSVCWYFLVTLFYET